MEELQAPALPVQRAWVREYVDDEPDWEFVEFTPPPPTVPHLVEASLLTRGDLIRLPEGVAGAGTDVQVTDVSVFFGGAYVEWYSGDIATTVPMSDDRPVLLLATAAEQLMASLS